MTSLTRRRPNLISIKVSDAEYTAIIALATHAHKPLATFVRDTLLGAVHADYLFTKPTEFKHGYTGESRHASHPFTGTGAN